MTRSVGVVLVLAAAAWGQEELSLEQAVALAWKNNRQVKIAELEVAKAEDEVAVSRTFRLPQFQVNLLESQLFTRVDFTFPRGAFGVYPGTGPIPARDVPVSTPRRPNTLLVARATQPLSQLWRIRLGVWLRGLGQEAAQERLRLARQSVANEVERVYYGILQTESALGVVEESIRLLRELDRVATESLAQRVMLKSESLEVKARLAKADYEAATLGQAAATQKEQLNVLLGREPGREFRVVRTAARPEAAPDLEQARVRALAARPELREARLKLRQAELDRRVKKSEFLPEVSFSLNYLSPFHLEVLPKNVAAGGLLLSWDVFDWGRKKRELAAKDKTVEAAKHAVAEAEAKVAVEVGARHRKLEEARSLVGVVEMARATAEERLRVARNRQAEQAALLKDVLESQAALADVNHRYQQAVLGYLTAKSDFEKAVGQ
jgi:outer membrane protein TolC